MADERERREKLLALKDGVRSFFEVTDVGGSSRGWSAAFKAVRSNDYMADSFLAELRALIDYIEVEFETVAAARSGLKADPKTSQLWTGTPPATDPPGGRTPVAMARAEAPRKSASPQRPAIKSPPPAPRPTKVSPPPPPPRRNQYAELATSVSPEPQFGVEDPTGRTSLPPVHDSGPKRRR